MAIVTAYYVVSVDGKSTFHDEMSFKTVYIYYITYKVSAFWS